ncbi:hypothetical protein [Sedimentitalea todarodis]|uniref:Uncharacterized protein n=1 Tax=Sedimentitalea todarodis TaxID=1631240 RepID=A0ABU3VAG1_9RHOB|nr:hypothetical protein [Sedimentitalea todarodis]MDU9003156.1 hypothetical protein [Sedimentitalea todarodis]
MATLLFDGSLALAAVNYSLTGSFTALIASLIFVIASGARRHQGDRALVKQIY